MLILLRRWCIQMEWFYICSQCVLCIIMKNFNVGKKIAPLRLPHEKKATNKWFELNTSSLVYCVWLKINMTIHIFTHTHSMVCYGNARSTTHKQAWNRIHAFCFSINSIFSLCRCLCLNTHAHTKKMKRNGKKAANKIKLHHKRKRENNQVK